MFAKAQIMCYNSKKEEGEAMKKNVTEQLAFLYRGISYPYELHLGNVKRINLRVRPDGSIRMSAPVWTTKERREAFLLEHADWLIGALGRVEQRNQHQIHGAMINEQYLDGGRVAYLGEMLTLRVTLAPREQRRRVACALDSEQVPTTLYISVKDGWDECSIRTAVLEWKSDRLRTLIDTYHRDGILSMFADILPTYKTPYARFIAQPSAIRIHRMRSRWGSCNQRKGSLNFNLWLINSSVDCIEYVILHEFAHFLHPDHSAAFRSLLTRLMPDWKERRQRLNQTPIPSSD